jgi:hypothetical protein
MNEWRAASDLFGDDIVQWVTPEASVSAKKTPQSTAPRRSRRPWPRRGGGWPKPQRYCHAETSSAKIAPPFVTLSLQPPVNEDLREF